MPNILSLRKYSVAFGNRCILTELDLDVKETGVTHVLGACGSGKSTLFRSLAGLNDKSQLFRYIGNAIYLGETLGTRERPVLLEQKPASLIHNACNTIINSIPDRSSMTRKQQVDLVYRLLDIYDCSLLHGYLSTPLTQLPLLERRVALILGLVVTAPALLLLDEPTADLSLMEARQILRLINVISLQRAVMLIQHNQLLAKELNGNAILLAGGRIQEDGMTREILSNPKSAAGEEFVSTGTCAAPSPDSDFDSLDQIYIDKYKPKLSSKSRLPKSTPFGPRGFHWIIRNILAATPRPGLLGEQNLDLQALVKVGINYLISLEEQETITRSVAAELGIEVYHFPIEDMQTPSLEDTEKLIVHIDEKISTGSCLAVHCKAGLGRTGTVIALYLVKAGMTPLEATRKVRCADPRMIQSEQQENFIKEFHSWLTNQCISLIPDRSDICH